MRKFLFLLLLCLVSFASEKRVVAVDWTAAEILSFLEYKIAAIGDKRNYKIWVKEPNLDEEVIDLGLRMKPNLENLIKLKADVIIIPSFFEFNKNTLVQYANIAVIDAYKEGDLYENLIKATNKIAKIIDKESKAKELIEQHEKFFEKLLNEFIKFGDRPFAVVQFVDNKRVRIYGKNSIYGVSLEKLGLKNAIGDEFDFNLWGIATIPITSLFSIPKNTRLVVIEPNPVDIEREIKFNGIYRALGFFNDYIKIKPVWSAGGFISMQRFATILLDGLR